MAIKYLLHFPGLADDFSDQITIYVHMDQLTLIEQSIDFSQLPSQP